MVRIGAIFIALCMVLIAASLGAVLFLRFGFSVTDSALAALGVLTVLAVYNTISGRRRDRAIVNDQLASLQKLFPLRHHKKGVRPRSRRDIDCFVSSNRRSSAGVCGLKYWRFWPPQSTSVTISVSIYSLSSVTLPFFSRMKK